MFSEGVNGSQCEHSYATSDQRQPMSNDCKKVGSKLSNINHALG